MAKYGLDRAFGFGPKLFGGEEESNNPSMLDRILQLAQLVFGGLSIGNQNEQNKKYERDIQQQISSMMNLAGQYGPATLGAYDASARPAYGELTSLRPRLQEGAQDIIGGFLNRYNTAKSDLEGYGKQQKADIDEYFADALTQNMADLQERGIASTTARTSGRTFNTGERSKEQRRFGEQLQLLRRNVLDPLYGDYLGAKQYGLGIDEASTGNIINFLMNNASNRANLIGQGLSVPLNTLGSINYMPPGDNPYPGIIGQNLVGPIDYSKGQSSWAPWLQAAGPVAGAATAGLFL